MLTLFLIIFCLVWAAGIPWFWHLQSRSRSVVEVTAIDRWMTVFWLPTYLVTISLLGLSSLVPRNQR